MRYSGRAYLGGGRFPGDGVGAVLVDVELRVEAERDAGDIVLRSWNGTACLVHEQAEPLSGRCLLVPAVGGEWEGRFGEVWVSHDIDSNGVVSLDLQGRGPAPWWSEAAPGS